MVGVFELVSVQVNGLPLISFSLFVIANCLPIVVQKSKKEKCSETYEMLMLMTVLF